MLVSVTTHVNTVVYVFQLTLDRYVNAVMWNTRALIVNEVNKCPHTLPLGENKSVESHNINMLENGKEKGNIWEAFY